MKTHLSNRLLGRALATVSRTSRNLALGAVLFLSLGLVSLAVISASHPPPAEPSFEGKPLTYWINAEPDGIATFDGMVSMRTRALRAMGQDAVEYLRWMLRHPRHTLNNHTSALDRSAWWSRLRHYLPTWLQSRLAPQGRQRFHELVLAVEFIGPAARQAAPDLIRLWESDGNPEYRSYNGFPLALGELGSPAPEVIAALHRHFHSRDRLHGSLCAFSAWRLNPNDTEAIDLVRKELNSRDSYAHARYTLLHSFDRWSSTNIGPFVVEVKSLVDAPCPAVQYKPNVEAAKRMLQSSRADN